jgi:hypothetical protein
MLACGEVARATWMSLFSAPPFLQLTLSPFEVLECFAWTMKATSWTWSPSPDPGTAASLD